MRTFLSILFLLSFGSAVALCGDGALLEKKLKDSRVKEFELDEVSVTSAFKRISEVSRSFSPDKRKVNIYLIAPREVKNRKITVRMKDSSLYDIIKYAALLSGLEMKIDEYAVVLKAKKK